MFTPDILNELIKTTQLTLDAVIEGTGIPKTTLRQYLAGLACPSVNNMEKIADFFSVPIDFLMGRCTKEQYDNIMNDYAHNFMQLRTDAYEKYLVGRKKFTTKVNSTYETPYPYNLIGDILSKPVDFIISEKNYARLNEILDSLPLKEKNIISDYYEKGKSLQAIGDELSLSKERIRQIIERTNTKLRHPSKTNYILGKCKTLQEVDEYYNEKMKNITEKEEEINKFVSNINYYCAKYNNDNIADLIYYILKENECNVDISQLNFSKDLSIDVLNLSTRTYHCLMKNNFMTVGALQNQIKKDSSVIEKLQGMGKKSYLELMAKLHDISIK